MASMHSVKFYDKCRDKCDSCKKASKQCYEYMANPDFLKKALTYEINDVYIVKIVETCSRNSVGASAIWL